MFWQFIASSTDSIKRPKSSLNHFKCIWTLLQQPRIRYKLTPYFHDFSKSSAPSMTSRVTQHATPAHRSAMAVERKLPYQSIHPFQRSCRISSLNQFSSRWPAQQHQRACCILGRYLRRVQRSEVAAQGNDVNMIQTKSVVSTFIVKLTLFGATSVA